MRCADCDTELEPYDTIYSYNGGWYCEDCFAGKRDELSLAEFAELIGREDWKVEELEFSMDGYDL